MRPFRSVFLLFTMCACSRFLGAQVPNRPAVPNWSAPAVWRPAPVGGGLAPMTDVSEALAFVAIAPCRIADTRGLGFTGQAGPPALDTGTRTFQIAGTVGGVPAPCGIPPAADAVSFQFTIVTPNTAGNLIAWPAGGPVPTVSVLNWSAGETALGNGTVVPLSLSGALSVRINAGVGTATGHLVMDVNGYYSNEGNPGTQFVYVTNDSFLAGLVTNVNAGDGSGFRGGTLGTGASASGLVGESFEVTGQAAGVLGRSNSLSAGTAGVRGRVSANAAAHGVVGEALGTTGVSAGVFGRSASTSDNAAGVLGRVLGTTPIDPPGDLVAGVRGEATADGSPKPVGVFGVTKYALDLQIGRGVVGRIVDSTGASSADGVLGYRFCSMTCDNFAGLFFGNVEVHGALTATGTKSFIEPTAADPSKMIAYVSLEGPESGTYFRGRGRFTRGIARIPVASHFREVTSPEGLTVQITPLGGMATFGVVKLDLDEIVVQGSRDLEFSYLVQGVRRAYENHPVIQDSTFLPESAEARMPDAFPPEIRRRLVNAGVYHADGTVNLETAERLGLARAWRNREAARPER
jgi:hypothetical protein